MGKKLAVALLTLLALLAACEEQNKVVIHSGEQKYSIQAEVVSSPEERARGLMFREHLEKNRGMLFVFEKEDTYPFWMKNTLIPLDMVWISEGGIIVDIKRADPCKKDPCKSYIPEAEAKYVLEVNQNYTFERNIEVGDKAEIRSLGTSNN